MWCCALFVVVITVSSVTSVVDVKNNDILSEDTLQDLFTRTKKSPNVIFGRKKNWGKEDKMRTWNGSPNVERESESILETGKSSAEITALLAEDIKERLVGLKELEDTYRELKSDLSNRETLNNKEKSKVNESLNYGTKTILESKISEDKDLFNEDSVRIVRQYGQDNQNYQNVYGGRLVNPEDLYLNKGRYHDSTQSSMNLYGDKGDPYLAQYYSYARTYGAAGYEAEKTEHPNPIKPLKQLKQIIPNVINALAEITTPTKPVQTAVSGGHSVKPGHHPVKKPEHKPPPSLHIQDLHGKKPKGIEPIFFSKQLIFGIGGDKKLNTKNYYGSGIPEVHNYPSQPYYPSGYSYYAPASYWAPLRDDYPTVLSPEANAYYPAVYSLNPEGQTSYDPTLPSYPQGNAYIEPLNSQDKTYIPVDSNYKSVLNPYYVIDKNDANMAKDLSQSELRMDSSPKTLQHHNEEDIELEIKKVQQNIGVVKSELDNLLNNTKHNENKEVDVSRTMETNPKVNRRHAFDEEGSSKMNKLCYKGKFDDKNGKFDFVESDC